MALADAVDRYAIPHAAIVDLVRGGLMDVEQSRYESWDELREYCRCVAGAVGIACAAVYGPREPEAAVPHAETLGLALQQINIMRDVPEDWRLGRVYLPGDELARFGVTEADIAAGRTGPEWRSLMAHQAARADLLLSEGLRLLPLLDRRSRLGVRAFAGIYRGLARADPRAGLRCLQRAAEALGGGEGLGRGRAARPVSARRGGSRMRAVVVGGGLAGLAAALDLADAGHGVTLLEARPTLGGAVQTLPEREGDPSPPPDNGQHIALGCCTEYLRFLERVGRAGAVRRGPLALPVVGEDGRTARIGSGPLQLARYRHLPLRERFRLGTIVRRLGRLDAADHDGVTFATLLRELGQSDDAITRFWDVFMRPALNLRAEEAAASVAIFTVQTALLGGRGASDLVLPAAPLGAMHGDAAGNALRAAGAEVRPRARVVALEEDAAVLADGERISGDAFVVALPPAEGAGSWRSQTPSSRTPRSSASTSSSIDRS